MSLQRKSLAVQSAALHLVNSAELRKKDGNDANPLEVLSRKFGDHAAKILEKLGATNDEIKAMRQKQEQHESELLEINQRLSRGGGGESFQEPETIGKQVAENEGLKDFVAGQQRGRYSMQVKATITSGSTSGGALVDPARDGVVTQPQRRLTIRNLLPVVNVTTGSVEYPRVTQSPNAADVVAEGSLKPEASMSLELVPAPIRTIAHWIPASRQILDDAPQLRGIIDTELLYGLKLKEEQQLLYGSGTGQNILGMVTQATAFAAPFVPVSQTMIDTIGLAILQTALTDLEPDGIVVSSADWMRMQLTKDANGNYIIGNPQAAIAKSLFGLPVVPTPAMTVDKFLVGAFQAAGTIYDRWEARVEVATEHADFFTRNLVAILCEERIGLAVKRPSALTYGDFGNVP